MWSHNQHACCPHQFLKQSYTDATALHWITADYAHFNLYVYACKMHICAWWIIIIVSWEIYGQMREGWWKWMGDETGITSAVVVCVCVYPAVRLTDLQQSPQAWHTDQDCRRISPSIQPKPAEMLLLADDEGEPVAIVTGHGNCSNLCSTKQGANEILNDRKLHKCNSAVIHLQNMIVPASHANIISNFITTDWCVVCKISFSVFWFSMFILNHIQ